MRYYGWYSNVSRGKRRKAQEEDPSTIEGFSEISAPAAKRAWARIIKQVYEVDLLVCPQCGGPVLIMSLIEHLEVIQTILTHLRFCAAQVHSPLNPPQHLPDSPLRTGLGAFRGTP